MLTATGENAAVDGLKAVVSHLGLHTGNPGSAGSNEVTGGSPAYARKAVTWGTSAAGVVANITTALAFDVPAATTVYVAGFWSALTVGTFHGYAGIGTSLIQGNAYAADTGDVLSSAAHGLVNGNNVFLEDVGETLPAGLSEGVVYFVVGATTDTFQLSLTLGGSAVAITANGDVKFSQTKPETFGSQGTLTIGIGSVVLDATPSGTA